VQDSKPCPGDPIKNPIIAPTVKSKNGGRYGYTRTYPNGAAKFHDGLDIQAAPGSKIYAPFDGIIIDTRNSFAPNEYKKDSYGNYVSIKFTLQKGQIIILKYNHLNSVNVTNGAITAGSIIGTSGITGNANSKDVIPHVDIQARNVIYNKEVRTNPEQYLATKFDSQGNPSNQPCQ
jgi:murein DD-endopeptidase MepM/ murein hydrolase activator NlpD